MYREAGTAAEFATEILRGRILSGELAPGAPLNQEELATALGMSRIPVRDALRALAAERLVAMRARSTAVVAALSIDDLQELYELRLAIEPMVSRIALPNVRRSELLQMEEMLELMQGADDDAWLQANNRFHALIYEQAERPRMTELLRRARQQTDRYIRVYLSNLGHGHLDAEHRAIFEAAVQGDANAVQERTRAHLAGAYDTILKVLLREQRTEEHRGIESKRPA